MSPLTTKGTMIPSMYFETGTLLMRNPILMSKLLFLHHLANLSDDSLSKELNHLKSKSENYFLLILTECKGIIKKWKLGYLNSYTKNHWKKIIKY